MTLGWILASAIVLAIVIGVALKASSHMTDNPLGPFATYTTPAATP